MIYTGNFANEKIYLDAGLTPISIARWAKHFTGRTYQKLAPPYSIIKMEGEAFVRRYYSDVLDRLNVNEVVEEIDAISHNPILLCYEKPEDLCHRQLVRDWLVIWGYESEEYRTVTEAKVLPSDETLSLFD